MRRYLVVVPWAAPTVVSILRDAGILLACRVRLMCTYICFAGTIHILITALACTYVGIDHVCAPVLMGMYDDSLIGKVW
jgi:hypothetical protein